MEKSFRMKTQISIKIGKIIQQARKAKGLTQKEVADKFFMGQQQYSRWETGLYEMNYEQIEKICKLLEITPNELFDFGF